MTKISLREYTREIEILLDQGSVEETIEHCKHILKVYPKHVDTYRLLGKAYLENKRYGEASDIFQRVLTVIPDDFVSQIGMSIIREDEGNFDAAIWHIERAFEIQPANAAIQDEIRRLYGRRDGIHLSKIRLTRGALIRMYMQGELYNQAISEARASLADDPQRMDLEVLLATLYYMSGQKVESAEICTKILNKMPFCLEANKILSILLAAMNRSEDAKIFQQRIYSLQPYAAHISKNAPTINQVPDSAVTLEKLDLALSSTQGDKQPEWAQTIGVEVDAQADEALPDWLPSLAREHLIKEEEESEFPEIMDYPHEMEMESDQKESTSPGIPDWMKAAGWEKTANDRVEEFPIIPEQEGTLEETEIPEWLQGLSPKEESTNAAEEISGGEAQIEERPNFLPGAKSEEIEDFAAEGLPDWLQDLSIDKETEEKTEHSEKEGLFSENILSEEEGQPVIADASTYSDQQTEENDDLTEDEESISEWLKTLESASTEQELASDDIPGWLKVEEKDTDQSSSTSESAETMEVEEPQGLDKPEEKFEDSLDWFNSLVGDHDSEQETFILSPEESLDLPAEWIKEYVELDENAVKEEGEKATESAAQAVAEIDDEQITHPVEKPQPPLEIDVEEESPEDVADAFAWLESLAAKQGADEETLTTDPTQRDETPPDWLDTFSSEIEEDKESSEGVGTEPLQEKPFSMMSAIGQEITETEATLEIEGFDTEEEKQEDAIENETKKINESTAYEVQAEIVPSITLNQELSDQETEIVTIFSELTQENVDQAILILDEYVRKGVQLGEIINGLENAITDHPLETSIYQLLGDAYAKTNQFQKALESYTKAENLLF